MFVPVDDVHNAFIPLEHYQSLTKIGIVKKAWFCLRFFIFVLTKGPFFSDYL